MRLTRVVAACVAIAAAGFAAGAWSSAPPTPTEKRLTKSVAALQAQVKALRSDVRVLTTGLTRVGKDVTQANTNADKANQGLGFVATLGFCGIALAADGFQGTWQAIDQLSAATRAGAIVFGPQVAVDDTLNGESICQSIRVTRSQAVPPTIAPFSTALGLLRG